ncbi:MAG: J domain-containing protein [Acidimicrobiales bacterium]
MATHYQRLGVSPASSTEEVRAAYRVLARRLHPDRQSGANPAERALADRRMREINEAWRALGDPVRRRSYDESLRGPRGPAGSMATAAAHRSGPMPAADDDEDMVDVMGDIGPLQAHVIRGLPWIVLIVVFGAIFVFTAYATAGRSSHAPATPTPAIRPAAGTCLRIRTGPTPPATQVVACDGPHDVKLVTRVDERARCPAGTERRRLSTDGLLDCVDAS